MQCFQSREFTLELLLRSETHKETISIQIFASSPQTASRTHISEGVLCADMYFKISELSSTIKLHSHKLPLEVLMKIAAGSTESGKCSSLLEMADRLSHNAIPKAIRCKGNELPPTATAT